MSKLLGNTWPFLSWEDEFRGVVDKVREMEDTLWREGDFSLFESTGRGYDIERVDDGIVVSIPVPGLESKDIDIKVEKNVLSIKTTKESEESERIKFVGRLAFVRKLPSGASADDINPSLENGVLIVKVPVVEEKKEKAKKISIK